MLGGGSAWFFGGPGAILVVFWRPTGVIFFFDFLCKKPIVVSIAFRVRFFIGFGGALGAKIDGFWSQKAVRE